MRQDTQSSQTILNQTYAYSSIISSNDDDAHSFDYRSGINASQTMHVTHLRCAIFSARRRLRDFIVKIGFHAGKLINDIAKICSGGGGGKPNFAQAGAKDIDKLNLALEYARNDLVKKLKSYSDK